MSEEKIIDVKGTLEQLVKIEEPEMAQEEAIAKYEEEKKKVNNDDESESTEEQEHLKRVKQELLASLERVKKLEQQLYNQKEADEKVKLKVDKVSGGKSFQKAKEEKQIGKEEKERE